MSNLLSDKVTATSAFHTNGAMPRQAQWIPRRIIQTAKTADLPLVCRAAVANIRLLNPDFEYCFFDDHQAIAFIDREFPKFRVVFDGFSRAIQKFDFFRYLAVYRLGGFYLDTDVFLAKGLESLLDARCIFPFEELTISSLLRQKYGIDWEMGNYAFAAEPGNPFLAAVIENCVKSQRDPAWAAEAMQGIPSLFRRQFEVLYSTGPGLVTRTFAENPDLQKDLNVLFPADVGDPRSWHQFGCHGVHLMNASWRQPDGFFIRRLARVWENSRREKLLKQSLASGPLRQGAWRSCFAPATA